MIKQQLYAVNNQSKDKLPLQVLKAEISSERRSGLINLSLADQQGLLIPGGYIIHMIGMKQSLHLVFISRNKKIKKIVTASPGFKFYFSKSWYCLEIPSQQEIDFLSIEQQLDWE